MTLISINILKYAKAKDHQFYYKLLSFFCSSFFFSFAFSFSFFIYATCNQWFLRSCEFVRAYQCISVSHFNRKSIEGACVYARRGSSDLYRIWWFTQSVDRLVVICNDVHRPWIMTWKLWPQWMKHGGKSETQRNYSKTQSFQTNPTNRSTTYVHCTEFCFQPTIHCDFRWQGKLSFSFCKFVQI